MLLPPKDSVRYKVLLALVKTSSSRVTDLHIATGASRVTVRAVLRDFALAIGMDRYAVLPEVVKAMRSGGSGQIVPPRQVNIFGPALTGYKLNTLGNRPEAAYWADVPSRFGSIRK